MSGWDWLVVITLAGALIVTVALDQLRDRGRHDEEADHCRLMREVRRLP